MRLIIQLAQVFKNGCEKSYRIIGRGGMYQTKRNEGQDASNREAEVREPKIEMIIKTVGEAGVCLDEEKAGLLLSYYERLIETNKVMNLTAVTEFNDVVKKHFADSLTLWRVFAGLAEKAEDTQQSLSDKLVSTETRLLSGQSLIDFGTGAGFPGLPLAIAYPEMQVTLMDSLNKRVKFLEETVKALGLTNVTVIHARAEDLARDKKHREAYDLAVSRAVANMSTLLEYTLPFVKKGGCFVAYKSVKGEEELAAAGRALKLLGGKVEKADNFTLFDMGRSLIAIKKTAQTPKAYPRKAGMPGKKPL